MSEQQWHLDKKVPIALIAAMVIQLVAWVASLAWLAATFNADIGANRLAIARMEGAAAQREVKVQSNTTGIAVMNNALKNIENSLKRIENKLDEQE